MATSQESALCCSDSSPALPRPSTSGIQTTSIPQRFHSYLAISALCRDSSVPQPGSRQPFSTRRSTRSGGMWLIMRRVLMYSMFTIFYFDHLGFIDPHHAPEPTRPAASGRSPRSLLTDEADDDGDASAATSAPVPNTRLFASNESHLRRPRSAMRQPR